MQAAVSLGDDLRRHGDIVLVTLASVTIAVMAVTAFLDRNTNDNSAPDGRAVT